MQWGQLYLWNVFCLARFENLANFLALMKSGVCGMLMAKHKKIYRRTLDEGNALIFLEEKMLKLNELAFSLDVDQCALCVKCG